MGRVALMVVLILVAAAAAVPPVRITVRRLVTGGATVEQRLSECSAAESRLRERFEKTSIVYPPARIVLVGLKAERELRVLAAASGAWREVARFPILAASGGPGPKLVEGDRQVPEGFYGIESVNPNSFYHLAPARELPQRRGSPARRG
jgi:murein L,D-transpeptidase YafK